MEKKALIKPEYEEPCYSSDIYKAGFFSEGEKRDHKVIMISSKKDEIVNNCINDNSLFKKLKAKKEGMLKNMPDFFKEAINDRMVYEQYVDDVVLNLINN